MEITEEIRKNIEDIEDIGEFSDGYHTFNELYEYRTLYAAMAFNRMAEDERFHVTKSRRHHDGEPCFGGGWFIVTAVLPEGQISNHFPEKEWDLFKCPEADTAPEWDGHTPAVAAKRMRRFLTSAHEDMEKYKRMRTVAEWLAVKNKGAVTGSIALKERGIGLGRMPHDIDIIIDADIVDTSTIIIPPDATEISPVESEDGYVVKMRCMYRGIKIEFIAAEDSSEIARAEGMYRVDFGNGEYMLEGAKYSKVEDILKAKKRYAEEDVNAESACKHGDDVKVIEKFLEHDKPKTYRCDVSLDIYQGRSFCPERLYKFFIERKDRNGKIR